MLPLFFAQKDSCVVKRTVIVVRLCVVVGLTTEVIHGIRRVFVGSVGVQIFELCFSQKG